MSFTPEPEPLAEYCSRRSRGSERSCLGAASARWTR